MNGAARKRPVALWTLSSSKSWFLAEECGIFIDAAVTSNALSIPKAGGRLPPLQPLTDNKGERK